MKKAQFCVILLTLFLITLLGFSSICMTQMGTWTQKADMPTARNFACTAVVDGRIYAIGGYMNVALDMVEEYDPTTDTWAKKADMPGPVLRFATAVVDGKIHAIGGNTVMIFSTVSEYDPATDTWTKKADMPKQRNDLSASVVNGKIYAIGGNWALLVEEYDPVTDTWTEKARMPNPSSRGFSSAVVNGKIYAIGGHLGDEVLSTVEEYDPATDTWTQKTDMPTARTYSAIAVVNEKIYVIGGASIPVYGGELSIVEIYDPATDTWTKGTDMPTARVSMHASAVDGRIYVIGGFTWDSGYFSTVEVYDTGLGMEVTEISPQEGPVAGGGDIAIFGSDFLPEAKVTIGGKPLIQQRVTESLITGIIPPGTEGEQDIGITVPDFNYSSTMGSFTYTTPSSVILTRITPTNGKQAGGDLGSISGSGFLPGATVTIGGDQATDVGVTSTLINFRIPPGTEGAKDVVVINPDGQKDTLRDAYTYNPFPVIEKLSPRYGGPLAGGTEIIITGSHFMEGVEVTIGENRAQKPDFFSPTELRLKTPPDEAGLKAVRVINPDGQYNTLEDGFTYNPAPGVSSVEPDAGSLDGGTEIVITGRGFLPGAYVLIGGAEARVERLESEAIITAKTPLSNAGVKDVVVVNPDGQKATLKDAFTYNPAPDITGVTPNNGRLAGEVRITIKGSGFLPGAKVYAGIGKQTHVAASSVEVMSSNIVIAVMPPGKSGPVDVVIYNPDNQEARLPDGFTYNPMPTIASITPNYGSSSGGTKIIIEGSGFLQGGRVMIGELPATTQVKSDTIIEATAPSLPQGVWDVRVVNPDTQEVVRSKGFISVGEMAYNYPNPFRASQGTTFRYVTNNPVQSVTVKIFNLAGVPIDIVQQTDSNEVKWHNTEVHAGLYVYLMEVELEDGRMKQFRSVLEVRK